MRVPPASGGGRARVPYRNREGTETGGNSGAGEGAELGSSLAALGRPRRVMEREERGALIDLRVCMR